MAVLSRTILLVRKDPGPANDARDLIKALYPKVIGRKKQPISNPAQIVLFALITLAEKYGEVSLIAMNYYRGELGMHELQTTVNSLQHAYSDAKRWAPYYQQRFNELQVAFDGERQIPAIILEIAEINREALQEETKRMTA